MDSKKTLAVEHLQNILSSLGIVAQKANTLVNNLTACDAECRSHPYRNLFAKSCSCVGQTRDYATKLERHLTTAANEIENEIAMLRHSGADPINIDAKPLELTPEEQELAYELKAQLMRNIKSHCDNVQMELTLQKKIDDLEQKYFQVSGKNRAILQSELSRSNALKLMRLFERKARDANYKFEALKAELDKMRQLAKKYQTLYEQSQNSAHATGDQSAAKNQPTVANKKASVPIEEYYRADGWRVGEIMRRNEAVINENDRLRLEIKALRRENNELLTKTKQIQQQMILLSAQLSATEQVKEETVQRLHRKTQELDVLKKSFDRQASDWLRDQQASVNNLRLSRSINMLHKVPMPAPAPTPAVERRLPLRSAQNQSRRTQGGSVSASQRRPISEQFLTN